MIIFLLSNLIRFSLCTEQNNELDIFNPQLIENRNENVVVNIEAGNLDGRDFRSRFLDGYENLVIFCMRPASSRVEFIFECVVSIFISFCLLLMFKVFYTAEASNEIGILYRYVVLLGAGINFLLSWCFTIITIILYFRR